MPGLQLRARIAVSCVALLGISACGSSSAENPVNTSDSVGIDTSTPSSSTGNGLLGTTLSGESFSLNDALAQSPVVMWFWAPG
jgi:hypothetical protein